jgi:hypothetical protein
MSETKGSLSTHLADFSAADEARCDAWFAAGDELRAAVGWRVFQGKASVFEAMSGIPQERIVAFVETGEISEQDRRVLEALR